MELKGLANLCEYADHAYYCQYAGNLCINTLPTTESVGLFFAYPSYPEAIADAVEAAIQKVKEDAEIDVSLIDWKDLAIEGNLIFCQICDAIKTAKCTIVNLTQVNFNVLFEFGYAIGRSRAVWPIVEAGLSGDRVYSGLETITTIGYSSFTNSNQIYDKIKRKKPWKRVSQFDLPEPLAESPSKGTNCILYLKSAQDNEPSLRITETLEISDVNLITDDPNEIRFQPISWYIRKLKSSYAVVIHLGSDRADDYRFHGAKCALVAGLSLALGRRLLIIGENMSLKPIDYGDITLSYKNATQAENMVGSFIKPIIKEIQKSQIYHGADITVKKSGKESANLIQNLEIGDYIAELEETDLDEYYIETAEFTRALKPGYRMFVGRKGSGKSANFQMLVSRLLEDKKNLICRIKPKTLQLNELLNFVKNELHIAKRGYLLQSFWKFMLYSESIKTCYTKIVKKPIGVRYSKSEQAIVNYVVQNKVLFDMSFTSRLLDVVKEICANYQKEDATLVSVSEILHITELQDIQKRTIEYLSVDTHQFAIILDGLDANWRIGEDYETAADILVSLVEVAGEIQSDWERGIARQSSETRLSIKLFLRSDIFDVLKRRIREPDKMQYDVISWGNFDDLFHIIETRVAFSISKIGVDELNWEEILEPGFSVEVLKKIIQNSILPKPRDIILYFQRALSIAQASGSKYLTRNHFKKAYDSYSDFALESLGSEPQPYIPDMEDLLLEFGGGSAILKKEDIEAILAACNVESSNYQKTIDFLIDSNFLGYAVDEYSYRFPITPREVKLAKKRARRLVDRTGKPVEYKIHNAFHVSLELNSG